ncbi:UNVERIFIED_CONTAM: hypothetical protein FKN15_075868 [Acipenser sinensis]
MERQGNREVMPLFKEEVEEEEEESKPAVRFHPILKKVEPLSSEEGSEVREGVPADPVTPKVVSARFLTEKDDSSVVKYRITATQGGKDACRSEPLILDSQKLRFFTPVCRSVRIERASCRLSPALQDHDPCVTSFQLLLELEVGGAVFPAGEGPTQAHSIEIVTLNITEQDLSDQTRAVLLVQKEESGKPAFSTNARNYNRPEWTRGLFLSTRLVLDTEVLPNHLEKEKEGDLPGHFKRTCPKLQTEAGTSSHNDDGEAAAVVQRAEVEEPPRPEPRPRRKRPEEPGTRSLFPLNRFQSCYNTGFIE